MDEWERCWQPPAAVSSTRLVFVQLISLDRGWRRGCNANKAIVTIRDASLLLRLAERHGAVADRSAPLAGGALAPVEAELWGSPGVQTRGHWEGSSSSARCG